MSGNLKNVLKWDDVFGEWSLMSMKVFINKLQ